MRKLIEYIRSVFCKHEWELLSKNTVYSDTNYWGLTTEPYIMGTKWTYRCKKCGYFKTHKNF